MQCLILKKRGGGGKSFYVYEQDTNSGFYINPRKKIKNKIKVNVDTIDAYCQKRNIKYINFLKIDCEGSEPEILCGAKKLINAGAIDCIYLELSIGNLYSKIDHQIYDIEKMLYKNFSLCGLNTNGNYAEIINSVHQHAKHLTLCLFYLKKQIFNKLKTKI